MTEAVHPTDQAEALLLCCKLCSSTESEMFEQLVDRGIAIEYRLCRSCGLVYLWPQPSEDELQSYYATAYRASFGVKDMTPNPRHLRRAAHLTDYLEDRVTAKIRNHLDIGCGNGALLQAISQTFGCASAGIELDEECQKYVRDQGLKVFGNLRARLAVEPEPADLVTMSHVLEHLSDPVAFLVQLREEALRSDGWLLLEVPNVFGTQPYGVPHNFAFSRDTLRATLRQADYDIRSLDPTNLPYARSRRRPIPLAGGARQGWGRHYLTCLAQPRAAGTRVPQRTKSRTSPAWMRLKRRVCHEWKKPAMEDFLKAGRHAKLWVDRKRHRLEIFCAENRNSSTTPMNEEAMVFTGERMVPEGANAMTFWEHVYRYRFAARLAPGRRILDIACGEGYGSAALREAGAQSVIGVDIAAEAVAHARAKYGIDARVGDAEKIPLSDGEVDLVVSFETLEHVPDPAKFLDECARVLAPGGTLVVSTPNKEVYADRIGHENPFHCSELTLPEFKEMLSARFDIIDLFTQRPTTAPLWSPRWLAAQSSPAFHLRGPRRLALTLRRLAGLPPLDNSPVPEVTRRAVVKTILDRDWPGAGCVNGYAVRRPARLADDRPMYFIAVAQRRASTH